MKEILKIIKFEGKGILYYNYEKYKDDFKNYKKDGKGIKYYNNDEMF